MSGTERRTGSKTGIAAVIIMVIVVVAFCLPETSSAALKKPGKVKNVKVAAKSYNSVSLTWNPAGNAKAYQIYRAEKNKGFKRIKKVSETSFTDKKLVTGKKYKYKIRAVNGVRKGDWCRVLTVTPRLNKPVLRVRSTEEGPVLTIEKVPGATGYCFFRDGKQIARQRPLTFVDRSVKKGTTHKYKVKAYRVVKGKKKYSPVSQVLAASKTKSSAEVGRAAAVAWAKKIANDNSFTYGTGRKAHRRGCYFCGTNKKYKPAGYEKTYCCNPFVLAAYAHGAKHPKVLAGCKKGDCAGMLPSDWTKYGCFDNVGKTTAVPFATLKSGDIIISQKSAGGPFEHVWLYCGGNEYVDAGSEGWDAKSISVKKNAEKYYKIYLRKGCYVIRYNGKQ